MGSNPFDDRRQKHAIGRSGRLSETRLGKTFGARQTAASGAMDGFKGDITLNKFLLEAKSTTNDSMGLKFEWLVKIAKEAQQIGKHPALSVSFVKGSGEALPRGDWVMIPATLFRELTGE